jgi:hypothetical protein
MSLFYVGLLAVSVILVKNMPGKWISDYMAYRKNWMPEFCAVCLVFWLFVLFVAIYELWSIAV